MDYSYIFRSAVPNYEKFADFGFEKHEDSYICKKKLEESGFYVLLTVNNENINAEVYEEGDDFSDSKYALFDVQSATGSFVSQIRSEVQNIIEDFRHSCFGVFDLREKYAHFLETEFNCKPDFPWAASKDSSESKSSLKSERFSDYAVYRCPNQKWFALVMNVQRDKLGLHGNEYVDVINLKVDDMFFRDMLIQQDGILPAYHMNKEHWITVLLDETIPKKKICELIDISYELTIKR